jgi:hypothetical protein
MPDLTQALPAYCSAHTLLRMAYECRSEECNHEDLTEQVRAAVGKEDPVFDWIIPGQQEAKPKIWRVVVKCSKGHDNVFIGNGPP